MADYVGSKITSKRIFHHVFDDTAIDIIKYDEDLYMWIQYGPTEAGVDITFTKQYTKEQVIKMICFLKPCGNIPAIELFTKFDKS